MLNRCEQQLVPISNNHSISRVKGGIPPSFLQKDTCHIQGYTLRGGIKPSGIIGVHTLDTTANSVIHIHTHLSTSKNRTLRGGTAYLLTFFHWMSVPSIKISFNEWFIERV